MAFAIQEIKCPIELHTHDVSMHVWHSTHFYSEQRS